MDAVRHTRVARTVVAQARDESPLARFGQEGREDTLVTGASSFVNQNGVSTCTMYCMKREDFDVRQGREDRLEAGGRGSSLCAQDCRSLVAIVWDEESRTTVEL